MMYRMKLLEKPFEQIKKGEKQIEVRCFDEKRRNIKAGDTILFSKLPQEKEQLETTVTALYPYSTFQALYSAFPPKEFGCPGASVEEMIAQVRAIYPRERELREGVVGIRLKRNEETK